MALPFTTSDTLRVTPEVPYPAITACTRAFLGSQTCPGAFTLSTVQFGSAFFTTGCSTSVTFAGSDISSKLVGMSDFCMSLKK